MPQTNSGFVFALPSEVLFYLTDNEVEEQTTLDDPMPMGGNPIVLEMSLNSTALEMLLYLSRYSVAAIEHNTLLKRINSYIANWALEIYGIRDAQERRYTWAIDTLKLIRDGAPLFDEAGAVVPTLDSALTPQADGVDYGLDLPTPCGMLGDRLWSYWGGDR